jgi:hypothetical protein
MREPSENMAYLRELNAAQEPTPAPHKYTREEFERMGFEPVRAHVVIDYGRFGSIYPFDAEETPQGFAFWECQYNAGQLSDEGRAAIQDMIDQYEAIHD